jgi:CRISPR-associated protein Csd1
MTNLRNWRVAVFRELVQYGEELEKKGKLPPVGFYSYGAPIHWVVHLRADGATLEKTELDLERPYSGRTGNIEAHLLTDEAGYVFGLPDEKKDGNDPKTLKRAKDKLEAFRALIRTFLESESLRDPELKTAIGLLLEMLEKNRVQSDPRFKDIESKQWISFQTDSGALAGFNLFLHEDAKRFWVEEMQRRTVNDPPVFGECATCGKHKQLVYKIPLGVKLVGVTPLHSLNADAFVSHRSGFKGAHIGVCFDCADTASRAFNSLSNSEQHKRTLIVNSNKRDGLENQIALFWMSTLEAENLTLEVGDQAFDFDSLASDLALAIAEERPIEGKPRAELAQLAQLLEAKWRVKDGVLNLADVGFNLGILSPNVGRIALREWITVSLEQLKTNYASYFKATRMVSSWGDTPKPFSISNLVNAVESSNPNLSRTLLRTLMLGNDPPYALLNSALVKFSNPNVFNDQKHSNPLERARARRLQQQLMSGIKLVRFFKEDMEMDEVNYRNTSSAYLSGRLLSLLEEAQLRHSEFKINATIVDRNYGAACVTPGTTFGRLIRLATVAHLPDVGGHKLKLKGFETPPTLRQLVEDTIACIDEAGGFRRVLNLTEQADFAIGFYQQRAAIRASRASKETVKETEGEAQ